MCDIAHALLLERVESDARAGYVVAGAMGVEDLGPHEPDQARTRFEEWLNSAPTDRRAGISDEDWELRVALGVA